MPEATRLLTDEGTVEKHSLGPGWASL
jgi:hypothetical protein